MEKQAVLRGLVGFPIGIAVGQVFSIVFSLITGQDFFYPTVPGLAEDIGSEIGAVVVQTILCGILGSAFSAGSCIWEVESWSIAKQTGIYFLVISAVMLPIAYVARWMDRSIAGFVLYFAIFIAIFILIWIIQFSYWKRKVSKLNQKLNL